MIQLRDLRGLGQALKDLRWKALMKQIEVCRATGMTAPQVSRYENGRDVPTLESLVKYLNAVGADLGDLQRELDALRGTPPDPALEAARQRAIRRTRERARAKRKAVALKALSRSESNPDRLKAYEERLRALEERVERLAK